MNKSVSSPGPSFAQQAVLWGQAYEVLVKRGALACLLERHLIQPDHPGLIPWQGLQVHNLTHAMMERLYVLDEAARSALKGQVAHLAVLAFGNGYTAMREYLNAVAKEARKPLNALKLRALWCPIALPGAGSSSAEAMANNRERLAAALGIEGPSDPGWSQQGYPANADFILWLSAPKNDYLLVQEYSYDMPPGAGNYRDQGTHLDELTRHRRMVDSRSVFSRIAAEVSGEGFELSADLQRYFSALTSENKPLFKLCQAASYLEKTVELLRLRQMLPHKCYARALAVTPNGLESLVAPYGLAADTDARVGLMAQLGSAYRSYQKERDNDSATLTERAEALFKGMLNKLPRALRDGMKPLRTEPRAGADFIFKFDEELKNFVNPSDRFSVAEVLAWVDETEALRTFFGRPAREAIAASLSDSVGNEAGVSLRDLHSSAVVTGLKCAKRGRLNVIALEGNPGIGKTTALRRYLQNNPDGFLFLYVSPRVVINRDVTHGMARTPANTPTGILTITTNASLMAAGQRWHNSLVKQGLNTARKIDGAVVADGVDQLVKPCGSLLVLTPAEEAEIEAEHAPARLRKAALSELEDLVQDRPLTGVLKGIATAARELLKLNPKVERIVLTAALQGFRLQAQDRTTIDALSSLFQTSVQHPAGLKERQRFAQRISNIVVMVDELAGDGAGAGFVHTIARWLCDEFIDVFGDSGSPFTVTLVVSDASLANETVLERYLNAGERAPDKVLVSKSRGERPFELAATQVRIGGGKRQTLHVMTNSFPASALYLHFRVQFSNIKLVESARPSTLGQKQSPREAIRAAADKATLESARRQVAAALGQGAKQIIFFAQDKDFLRRLRKELLHTSGVKLHAEEVQVLDSSVPGAERKRLVQEGVRDQVKVFLMTSSGARGVSFPLTDWIIARVPRFNIEAGLMELAQLVYRGRGTFHDQEGVEQSGDYAQRHLLMLVDDYVVSDGPPDQRQWLRQALDTMTLLVLLRSTLLTRIRGDAGLQQPLAIVPVGAVGNEEIINLMSQYVAKFASEAEIYKREGSNKESLAVVLRAADKMRVIFSQNRLKGVAKKNLDGRSAVKAGFFDELLSLVADDFAPLVTMAANGLTLPEQMFFAGPVVVENWAGFDKQEMFAFADDDSSMKQARRQLIDALWAIDELQNLPAAIRQPAINLRYLLLRDDRSSVHEFKTLKELKSPNTWVAVPANYYAFMRLDDVDVDRVFRLENPSLWHEALARSLNAGSAVMPPLARYDSFPWAACVGQVNPLKLDLVFDDRYFMASNELNLLNTLLLAQLQDNE